ncbi:hypothetical protein [Treponema sp.]|uniref:hypothetical protein n=1 Tax=Treponema sp. TaxID=166 RepID=UPI0025E112C8|nr:hypothetical protein [Treponema sp.]MCR5217700.1 hypothetical protein [Treponema sp.]
MKKALNKIMTLAAMTAMVAGLTACSGSGEDENNSTSDPIGNLLEFPITTASAGTGDQVVFCLKYDKPTDDTSDESIKIKDAVMTATVNGVEVEMSSSTLTFALDEYGAKFEESQNLKEYKVKPSLNQTLSVGDTVTFQLISGEITGAGKNVVDLSSIVVALIDTNQNAGGVENSYYAELSASEHEYQALLNSNAQASEEEEEVVDCGLISSEATLDWGTAVSVSADKFATATAESKITVTYITDGTSDYQKFKMLSGTTELYAGSGSGITIDLTSESADDLHGVSFETAPSATPANFSYTPSADEWTAIKTDGFKLIGHGATITKIVLE